MLCWKISQNSQESTCAGVFFHKTTALPCDFIKKETPGQELFRDFYEIFQNAIIELVRATDLHYEILLVHLYFF